MTWMEGILNASRWLVWLTLVYVALLIALALLNWGGAERFWPGALNLYLPQILWALPGVMLALLFFKLDRSLTWLPMLCVLWVLGPVMGLSFALPAPRPAPGSLPLRVMTWNIKYGYYEVAPLLEELARRDPDVVFFQDAVGCLKGPLGEYFKNWQVRSSGQYLIASRYPLSGAKLHELPSSSQKQESFLTCQMRIGPYPVSLYNVHLKTPRRSLNAFRTARRDPWYLPEAIDYFHRNVTLRLVQAATLRASLGKERGPVIVAGDLNAPEASLVCATLRDAGLRDAFSERGTGYGFTYGHFLFKHRLPWFKLSWMRIDHIMVNAGIVTRRCSSGSGRASDHRPVIADLIVKYP